MGRKRTKPLPRGVYERKYGSGRVVYWIDIQPPDGPRIQERGGETIPEAVALLRRRRAEIEAGTYSGSDSGEQTVSTYSKRWLAYRTDEGIRSVNDEEKHVRLHIVPRLGTMRLSAIRPRDVVDWINDLERESGLSPKSIANVRGTLSAMLARARFDELILTNPAKGLPRSMLPKPRRVREVGAWTGDELVTLATDRRVPEDRRLAYAISGLTAARLGEVAGLRWEDIDTAARPLWRWGLKTQYDRRPLKTEQPRDIPIHPELQRVLEGWRSEGWARFMCRDGPAPSDLVVPRNRRLRGARPQHGQTDHHSYNSLGAKAVHRHAKLVGIDSSGRDFHSFRRAMITLARTGGARSDVLERITHNSTGQMIDTYTYFGWEALCEAVACIAVSLT